MGSARVCVHGRSRTFLTRPEPRSHSLSRPVVSGQWHRDDGRKPSPGGSRIAALVKRRSPVSGAVTIPCNLPVLDFGNFAASPFYNALQYNFRFDQYLTQKDRIYLSYYNDSFDQQQTAASGRIASSGHHEEPLRSGRLYPHLQSQLLVGIKLCLCQCGRREWTGRQPQGAGNQR